MSIESAFAAWVAAHDEAGTPVSSCLRPPLADRTLREVERQVGTVPEEVVELHRLADGIDDQRWREFAPGYPYDLAPAGPEFVDLATAAETARRNAGLRDRSPVTYPDVDESSLWPDPLGLAYPIWSGEYLAVETGSSEGRLWIVRWEATDIRPLDLNVAGLLDGATERFRQLRCRWDADKGVLDFDVDLEEQLPAFPT